MVNSDGGTNTNAIANTNVNASNTDVNANIDAKANVNGNDDIYHHWCLYVYVSDDANANDATKTDADTNVDANGWLPFRPSNSAFMTCSFVTLTSPVWGLNSQQL